MGALSTHLQLHFTTCSKIYRHGKVGQQCLMYWHSLTGLDNQYNVGIVYLHLL